MTKAQETPQENAFVSAEADAWFKRAGPAGAAATAAHPVLRALRDVELLARGILLDIDGASGNLAEGFRRAYPGWTCRVLEPSAAAIDAGRAAFPDVQFTRASVGAVSPQEDVEAADLVVLSGVLHWVDRAVLARAVANIDMVLRDGGFLAIHDFDPAYQRANRYAHRAGLFTYKQNYAACFSGLGIYHEIVRRSATNTDINSADPSDPYDRQWVTTVLRKDLFNRYAHGP